MAATIGTTRGNRPVLTSSIHVPDNLMIPVRQPDGMPRRISLCPRWLNRHKWIIVAVGLVAVLATAGLAAPWRANNPQRHTAAGGSHVQTVAVTRTDLSTSRTFDGKLGFGVPQTVKGGRAGILTWIAPTGQTVELGKPLYRVNDEPIPLFYGTVPLYRRLDTQNLVGRDVRVIVEGLKALHYATGTQPAVGRRITGAQTASPGPVPGPGPSASATTVTVQDGDGVLTADVLTAIRKWQADLHRPVTGVVDVGDVVVLPGPVRVDSAAAQVGDQAAGAIVKVSTTGKIVTVAVGTGDAGAIQPGTPVTVRLPDNTSAPGSVSDISKSAEAPEGDAAGQGGREAKITVTVALTDLDKVKALETAPVQVDIPGEVHKGVLTVPITALLALREGGYGVQLPDGTVNTVTTGLFAKGMAEISGEGISEGTRVVTSS
jgi:hypothetical protein